MFVQKQKKKQKRKKTSSGKGFVNTLINKLPFELHIPGYNYCGPGTKLEKRLARGDKGINPLDSACQEHDIAYSSNKDLPTRHKADKVLYSKAKQRFKSSDASFGERAAALGVAAAMKTKVKLGMGCQKRKRKQRKNILKFNDLTRTARDALKNRQFSDANEALALAIKAVREKKGRKRVKPVRIIPIPKTGGILPLLPIFAALGALGSIGGGAAAVAKAVNDAKAAKEDLKERQRHNEKMEAIALGKSGSGLYLKPYKTGLGLFLGPYTSPKQYP